MGRGAAPQPPASTVEYVFESGRRRFGRYPYGQTRRLDDAVRPQPVGRDGPLSGRPPAVFQFLCNAAMQSSTTDTVVKEGTFLYDDTVVCDLRIVHSLVRFGTGDYEDPPEIRDDAEHDTFYVEYGSTTERGVFNAGGGGHPTLFAAVGHAEAAPGFGKTIVWR
jgi:hypothetical protein